MCRSRTPEKADETVAEIIAAGGTAVADYSDVAAWYGGFGQGNYAAAKGALAGLNGVVAVEGIRNNVLSNLICTEGITRMNEELVPKERHEAMKAECASWRLIASH